MFDDNLPRNEGLLRATTIVCRNTLVDQRISRRPLLVEANVGHGRRRRDRGSSIPLALPRATPRHGLISGSGLVHPPDAYIYIQELYFSVSKSKTISSPGRARAFLYTLYKAKGWNRTIRRLPQRLSFEFFVAPNVEPMGHSETRLVLLRIDKMFFWVSTVGSTAGARGTPRTLRNRDFSVNVICQIFVGDERACVESVHFHGGC